MYHLISGIVRYYHDTQRMQFLMNQYLILQDVYVKYAAEFQNLILFDIF